MDSLAIGVAAAIIPLILSGIGIYAASRTLAALGAIASIPYCVFASGYPLIGWIAWIGLAGNVLSAIVAPTRRDIAFAALSPFMAITVLLAVLALRGIHLIHR
jgi:hypothetical protein